MFKKSVVRATGLLASLLLATSAHAAMVTENFNFLSPEFTFKATVNFDNAANIAFPATAGLTVHEFTTTLGSFTLPAVISYEWVVANQVMVFGARSTSALDIGTDDVRFQASPTSSFNAMYYIRVADSSSTPVTNFTFNQDPYVPPTTPPNGSLPEPTSLALVGLAGLGLLVTRRRA